MRGRGTTFGPRQRERYCSLKRSPESVQWVLNDLDTGEVLAKSPGAERIFFGDDAGSTIRPRSRPDELGLDVVEDGIVEDELASAGSRVQTIDAMFARPDRRAPRDENRPIGQRGRP